MTGISPGDEIDFNLSRLRSWYSRPSQMRLVHSARQKTDFAAGLTAALGRLEPTDRRQANGWNRRNSAARAGVTSRLDL